eukprot:9482906-Pyramimonas_sp.AAC.1
MLRPPNWRCAKPPFRGPQGGPAQNVRGRDGLEASMCVSDTSFGDSWPRWTVRWASWGPLELLEFSVPP